MIETEAQLLGWAVIRTRRSRLRRGAPSACRWATKGLPAEAREILQRVAEHLDWCARQVTRAVELVTR